MSIKFSRLLSLLFVISLITISSIKTVQAQPVGVGTGATNTNGNTNTGAIVTAVSFLTISPDSRSGSMGDAGVAISPDVNANFWNPSKLAFIENKDEFALSYSPWLRRLVPEVNLAYLSYSHKLDERNTIGASLKYFNLGTIDLTDNANIPQGTYHPNEFSLDGSFARKFGNNLSLALSLRYIHSNLTNGTFSSSSGQQSHSGNSVAADVSMFYKNPTQEFGTDAILAFGVNISNIGSKISYTDAGNGYFIPTNLKVGVANTWFVDDFNQITLTLDLNKLLVPTPAFDANGNSTGSTDSKSVVSGIFGSFTDAPFNTQLNEISYSPGFEYWYNKQFALRAGYFYESPIRGSSQYITLGAGLKYQDFNLDFSYLIASQDKSALANTLRFTLGFTLGGK